MNANIIKPYILLLFSIILLGTACKRNVEFVNDGYNKGGDSSKISFSLDPKVVDMSKYPQARVFPGLVCYEERRFDTTMLLNLDYKFVAENLRISVPAYPQFSTGLYVAPGELLTIDVPVTEYAITLQVGAWTDNLSTISNPRRDPVVFTRMQLAPGRNYMRNLYGGHVYLIPQRPLKQPVSIAFKNVVKSPDFVLGETDPVKWAAEIRKTCVPYFEFRTKNFIATVPTRHAISQNVTNPSEGLAMWDEIIQKDFYGWEGLSDNPADPVDQAPGLPFRLVQDIQPVVGYGHSGYPVVAADDEYWFRGNYDAADLRNGGGWGTFHEYGHNNQQNGYWSWSALGETTCNLFIFKTANRLSKSGYPNAWPPRHPAVADMFPKALAFAAENSAAKNFDGQDVRINSPFSRITPFIQIYEKAVPHASQTWATNGWDFMSYLYMRARRAVRPSINDQDKHDFVYEALCEFTRQDWMLFFRAWGISVSNISLAKIAGLGYPIMNTKVWEYNPITKTGGTGTVVIDPYARINWSIAGFSSEETSGEGAAPNGRAAAILDGNNNTFWHARYSTQATNPPHWVSIDFNNIFRVNKSLDIKGFIFTQRQNSAAIRIKNVQLEYSMNGTTWTKLQGPGANGLFTLSTTILTPQTITLPTTITARFVKFTVPTQADINNSRYAGLAEFDVVKP